MKNEERLAWGHTAEYKRQLKNEGYKENNGFSNVKQFAKLFI